MGAKKDRKAPYNYEFFGPVGAAVLIVALPAFLLFQYYSCNASGCLKLIPFRLPPSMAGILHPFDGFDRRGAYIFLGWFAFQVVLFFILPGKWVDGVPVKKTGQRLQYKMNGLLAYTISLVGLGVAQLVGLVELSVLYDLYYSLAVSAIVFSYVLAVALYAFSFAGNAVLADSGTSGNAVYDFWMGHQLNPRIGVFDFKVFCELRPGLIGWCVLDVGMAAKQYSVHGTVTNSMVLVLLFQMYYVLDSFISEPALLTTKDVTDEGFGFMLAFGDLVWVPFFYCVQARYLVDHPVHLTLPMVLGVLAVNLLGLVIFRGANSQKNAFRTNPNDPALSHLKYLPTARGTRLLISGWWGMARHINYLGDILMAVAWCLPCGFEHAVPYFYVIYFITMLVHRDRRDGELCARKYGKDWDKYCQLVPWRILPYVY